jgi:menaquinone-dependent protoporphyrinogen IX oxidase
LLSAVIITGSKEFDAAKVAAHVLQTLRSSGLQGEYRLTNLYRSTGKKSLQIIVVSAPVASRALLPQPNGAEIIYV